MKWHRIVNIQFKLRPITGAQLEIASAPFEATTVSGSYGNNKHKQSVASPALQLTYESS